MAERVQIERMSRADRIHQVRRVMSAPSRLRGGSFEPVWSADGKSLCYVDPADRSALHRIDVATGNRTDLLDLPTIRDALREEGGLDLRDDEVPFDRFLLIDDDRAVRLGAGGRWFDHDLGSRTVTEVTEVVQRVAEPEPFTWPPAARSIRGGSQTGFVAAPGVGGPLRSPDGSQVLLAPNGSLSIRSSSDGRVRTLIAREGDVGYQTAGAAWAPDSLRAAVIRSDVSGLATVPVLHWLGIVEEVDPIPYVKAGGRTARARVDVVSVLSRQAVGLAIPEEDGQRFHVAGWRRGGTEVLVLELNRRGDRLRLYAGDAATGEVRVLIEEEHPHFFEGLSVGWRPPGWESCLDDGEVILWVSERDGWRHLYVYDGEGSLLRHLTEGDHEVSHVVGVDEAQRSVYYAVRSDLDRPMDVHVHRVNLDGGDDRRLTEGPGQHAVVASPDGGALLDRHSSIDRPDTVTLLRPDSTVVAQLSEADPRPLLDAGWREPEEFTAVAADGTTSLHGLLYHPPGFDPAQRYPLIEHIYAGPHRSNVGRTFADGKHAIAQVLSRAGFVVAVFDGRGTPERGAEFQGVVTRRFGQHEIADHAGVLEQLTAERAYLDADRIGITGGSWGGYFTIRAMLTRPDLFGTGVAIFPAVDLYDHNALAIEQYMKLPTDNPEGYRRADNTRLADQLDGDLLLVHGTSDVNATFSATMRMVEALTRASKPYDLLVMPEQAHDLSGHTGAYALAAVVDYFAEHL